jgi:hypothetical protein
VLALDPATLRTFDVIDVLDPCQLGEVLSRLTRTSGHPFNESGVWQYRLQDGDLMRVSFEGPITSIAERRLLSMMIAHGGDRFATQVDIGGDGLDAYCFTAMVRGRATLTQYGRETPAASPPAASFFGPLPAPGSWPVTAMRGRVSG